MDLTAEPDDSLVDSFFTCADLSNARFGAADVAAADFTGADLAGADLSEVQTHFPKYLKFGRSPAWSVEGSNCRNLVDRMTGMEGGQATSVGAMPDKYCHNASGRRLPVWRKAARLRHSMLDARHVVAVLERANGRRH
jgi:uncharacterized protein YjbI with pentapeptide repeats